MVNPQIITNSVAELQKSAILSRPKPWDLPDCPNQPGNWRLGATQVDLSQKKVPLP